MHSRWLRFIVVAVMCFGFEFASATSQAHAQDEKIDADFKGAVGLGLVGAELGAVIPAIAGVDATWAYIVFPIIGAGGGAAAGYFAIDHAGHAEASVAVLTAGMALVIPALVVTLWATAYDPDDEPSASTRGSGYTRARVRPALSASAQRQVALARAGSGALRLTDGKLALAAPGVSLVPGVERGEMRLAGANVSLLSGRF